MTMAKASLPGVLLATCALLAMPLPKASGIASSEKPQFRLQSSRLAAQMTMFAEAATLASSNVF